MSNIPENLIERARKLVVKHLCCEAVCSCSAGKDCPCADTIAQALYDVSQPKWFPIETAPKDGTPIIYLDARECIGEAVWMDKDEHEPDWWDEANTETVEPIYWMPKPALPTA